METSPLARHGRPVLAASGAGLRETSAGNAKRAPLGACGAWCTMTVTA